MISLYTADNPQSGKIFFFTRAMRDKGSLKFCCTKIEPLYQLSRPILAGWRRDLESDICHSENPDHMTSEGSRTKWQKPVQLYPGFVLSSCLLQNTGYQRVWIQVGHVRKMYHLLSSYKLSLQKHWIHSYLLEYSWHYIKYKLKLVSALISPLIPVRLRASLVSSLLPELPQARAWLTFSNWYKSDTI